MLNVLTDKTEKIDSKDTLSITKIIVDRKTFILYYFIKKNNGKVFRVKAVDFFYLEAV